MEKLLVNKELRYKMGGILINKNFSWEKIAQQIYQVYYEEAIAAWKAQRNKKNRRSEGK